jgi:hypothetical protein
MSTLDRRLGGIERRHADPPMKTLAMCMRSYVGVVSCESVLKRDVLALDRTHVNVQSKNVAETANQAKNNKQNKRNIIFLKFFY